MSKGIIIIETGEIPKDCYHCEQTDDTGYCRWAGIYIDHRVKPDEKYSCCPIQPMPEKKRYWAKVATDVKSGFDQIADRAYIDGWNECIDKLMGGSDGKETVNKG